MQRHRDAISAHQVTATNVIGIRKAINLVKRRANGWSVPKSAPTDEDVEALEDALEHRKPRVVGELHETGLKLLRDPRYAKVFDSLERSIIEDATAHFHLIGFERIGRRGEYAVPVYRITGKNGSFNFRNVPWQSGGKGPEVVENF
jgi:hypothetical protein